MRNRHLVRGVLILVLIFGLVAGIILAASFLKPLALALLLALLLVPVARKLEKSGWNRFLACLTADFIFILFIAGLFALLSNQVSAIGKDWPTIEKKGKEQIEKVQDMVVRQVGVSEAEQEEAIDKGVQKFLSGSSSRFLKVLSNTLGSLGDLILIMIYILLLLYYRDHFAKWIYRITPDDKISRARKILEKSKDSAVNYLGGRLILMFFLALFYAAGFLAFGVKYAVFYAVFAALLTIIPYVGNMIGVMFPLAMTLLSDDSGTAFFGVLGVFTVVQFIESYLLEPLIVGKKVHINPFFTIFIIVLGGAIWGVVGMMVAIPYLGILYVIMNNVPKLKPYAYLIGGEEDSDTQTGLEKKLSAFKKKIFN